ncbi:uncharacterized protein LY89DRAFT_701536 [Mollisia scopiformis]|uniref:NAD(P)-binding protein n=1 Tax=Mollisia scopiformis TaxID=149040 RepID=A0A132B9D7_MOLSC|nr:uncharacterized protein LY89DRAFT_701536 [Mollisia scopiformis]KUJ09016.1 hypothetical protein LY89DRAFT_701536 [Mollisia scopiformis]
MVKIDTIRASNAPFANQHHEGLVCVFAGATSGIGLATCQKMTTMLQSSTFYILGRSPERYTDLLDQMRELAPSNKIVYVETQVSLIASIDAACAQISSAEQKVDYLCMSPGGMPFQGAVCTLRLLSNLLPLLNRASQPRVLSILNGTREKKINEDDIGLEKAWGITAVVGHSTLLTSLAFDHLAAHDSQKHIVFIHSRTTYPSKKDGYFWWAFISVMQIVSGWMIRNFGMAAKESGERFAFLLISDTLSPGSWRTTRLSDTVPENNILKEYHERGWGEKIWDFTIGVWEEALIKGTA